MKANASGIFFNAAPSFMCNCSNKEPEKMTQADMMKFAIAGGVLFAAYRYGNGMVKAGALAVAAGVIAKRIPYVQDVL